MMIILKTIETENEQDTYIHAKYILSSPYIYIASSDEVMNCFLVPDNKF